MRVDYYGEGEPKFAVLGLVHGDEPCGDVALEYLRTRGRTGRFDGSVMAIWANERAAERSQRTGRWRETIDRETGTPAGDLNRAYGDDSAGLQSRNYEERVASLIQRATEGLPVYDLHATSAGNGEPFGLLSTDSLSSERSASLRRRVSRTGVDRAVDFQFDDGSGLAHLQSVEVEHTPKGSPQAVEQATTTVDNLLAAHGVVDQDQSSEGPTELYESPGKIDQTSESVQFEPEPVEIASRQWEFLVDDFESVQSGDVLVRSDDETAVVATRSFSPVLLSEGYDTHFGYVSELVGTV